MNEIIFKQEILKLGLIPNDKQLTQLKQYYELLIKWNEKINLTAITKEEDVYLKHFYDSLTIIKALDLNKVNTLCDIGTGAGFPGIVLKIFFPHLEITLIDSLNKRIVFLNEVINQLHLEKIVAIHNRAEEYGNKNREYFDVVTARAVANINTLLEYSIPLLKINGVFIAMKGSNKEEFKNIDSCLKKLNCKIKDHQEFTLYNNENLRSLISILKIKKTDFIYPRKYSEIKNKPL